MGSPLATQLALAQLAVQLVTQLALALAEATLSRLAAIALAVCQAVCVLVVVAPCVICSFAHLPLAGAAPGLLQLLAPEACPWAAAARLTPTRIPDASYLPALRFARNRAAFTECL